MDKSVFVVYNIIKRGDGMHYYIKTSKDSEASSDKYIHVNNFGYSEDVTDMRVRRERGRVDYQLIYVKSGSLTITENEGDSIVPAGSVCLYRPGEAQIYGSYNGAVEFCWIHFSGSGVEEMLSFFEERCYTVGQFPEFMSFSISVIFNTLIPFLNSLLKTVYTLAKSSLVGTIPSAL